MRNILWGWGLRAPTPCALRVGFLAGWPLRGLNRLSCGSSSAKLGGGYAPPHPAPTLSGKSRQKAAARRLRQKPLIAGFGRGDAQSAYFVRGLDLPWGLELCGVRPDPRPKPAGVFACACYCRSCVSGSGFRSLALRARVGVELRSGFTDLLFAKGFVHASPAWRGSRGDTPGRFKGVRGGQLKGEIEIPLAPLALAERAGCRTSTIGLTPSTRN